MYRLRWRHCDHTIGEDKPGPDGDYCFEVGQMPHAVKVPGPAAFHTLSVEIWPEG
jgi:hypothetical protein